MEPPPAALASATPRAGKTPWLRTATVLWIVTGVIAMARIAQFWGLHYGNTDDLTIDFATMKAGAFRTAFVYATQQARVFQLLNIPLYASSTMSLAGSGWYDLLNLSAFAGGSLLPVAAFYRYLTTPVLQLYVIAYFSTLPLLFAYCPPYSYPTYMFAPLAFCGAAMLLFEKWRGAQPGPRRNILLAFACMSLFLALCSYELIALLGATLLAIYFWMSYFPSSRFSLFKGRDVQAAIGVGVFYLALYVGWRLLFPPTYNGVQPALNLSLPEMARVVGTLSLTSSIFARYMFPQNLVYVDYSPVHQFVRPLYAPSAGQMLGQATAWQLLVAALTMAAAYKLVTSVSSRWQLVRGLQLAAVGVVALFLPNALFAIIPKISDLVLTGQLATYTGTAFSHIGFSLLPVVIVMIVAASSRPIVRAALGILVAVIAGWASLASSEFNQASEVYAHEQSAKWSVISQLAACRDHIPAEFFDRITAPRLWNFSTGSMAWGGHGAQFQHYWDQLASTRYRLDAYFYIRPQAAPKPLTFLDYRLAQDGKLAGIVIGAAPDGAHFHDVLIIKHSSSVMPAEILSQASSWLYQGPENTASCNDGLQIVRFTGPDLKIGTAQVYDLPNTSQ